MKNTRPEFAIANHSVLSVVTELHNYFRDLQSYYQMAHGDALSKLESTTDASQHQAIEEEIRQISEKMTLFHVLNNSISTTDTILHTDKMIEEFKNC